MVPIYPYIFYAFVYQLTEISIKKKKTNASKDVSAATMDEESVEHPHKLKQKDPQTPALALPAGLSIRSAHAAVLDEQTVHRAAGAARVAQSQRDPSARRGGARGGAGCREGSRSLKKERQEQGRSADALTVLPIFFLFTRSGPSREQGMDVLSSAAGQHSCRGYNSIFIVCAFWSFRSVPV
jgi:hypothetical protein